MIAKEVIINRIAFLQCDSIHPRPCGDCILKVTKEIEAAEFIDTDLIETTVLLIRNNSGQYDGGILTNLELSFAFGLLEDLVPYIVDKVKDGHR